MTGIFVGAMMLAVWVAAAAVLFVLPSWLLWNALVPEIFGLPEISYLQTFGLILLFGMMFGGPLKFKLDLAS